MDTAPLHEKLEDAYQALTDGRLQDALAAVSHLQKALKAETRLRPGPKPGATGRPLAGKLEYLALLLKDGAPRSKRYLRGHLGVNGRGITKILAEAEKKGIARPVEKNARPGLAMLYVQC